MKEAKLSIYSKIIQDDRDQYFLIKCLQEDRKIKKLTLLYRASDHNFSTYDFEAKCHQQSNLLFILKN